MVNCMPKVSYLLEIIHFLFVGMLEECFLPKQLMQCKKSNPLRYVYNIQLKKCDKLRKGICSGNANRFKTMKECQESCISKLNDFLSQFSILV